MSSRLRRCGWDLREGSVDIVVGLLGILSFVPPRTSLEEVLTGIWMQVLDLEGVGIHDNFFELGGHSLLATQAISRMHGVFMVEFPVHNFFETPTIAGLADAVSGICGGRDVAEEIARTWQELEQLSEEDIARKVAK
ncbi:MAG: phosphopantetheine-binding protein [Ignavibacteria bacterium]|nr:phosphopantetheine-binding protein [Ignavibacteria bacterium]